MNHAQMILLFLKNLRNIADIGPNQEAKELSRAFVFSRLDYYIALYSIEKL